MALAHFTPDAELVNSLPTEVLRQHTMLPEGLQQHIGLGRIVRQRLIQRIGQRHLMGNSLPDQVVAHLVVGGDPHRGIRAGVADGIEPGGDDEAHPADSPANRPTRERQDLDRE